MSNIEERVKQIIASQLRCEIGHVVGAAKFIEDLRADSLDTVEIIMAIEDEFGIEIPDEAAEKIATVQSAIDYVSDHGK